MAAAPPQALLQRHLPPEGNVGSRALSLVTAAPKLGRSAHYENEFDEGSGRFTYRFRDPRGRSATAARQAEGDNRALVAAHELSVPLIYFRGIAPGQYAIAAPAFVMSVDRSRRLVELEGGLRLAEMTEASLVPQSDVRRYATREALYRLHQYRFRAAVLRAYSTRCAVCRLHDASLLQAAYIIDDRDPHGVATIVDGIALWRSITLLTIETFSESIPAASCISLVVCSTSVTSGASQWAPRVSRRHGSATSAAR